MVGVHDRPGPRAAGDQGSEPPRRARLGRVGVEDARPPLPDDPTQREDRRGVGARRQLALEHRQSVELHSEVVGDVLHRLLSGGECPGDDDHVVSSLRLLVGELEHVESCTADVEPGDHVHDPHDGSACAGGGARDGATAVTPIVIQKMAASGMPPKRAAPLSPPASAATQAAGR